MPPPPTYRNALALGTLLQEYRLDSVLGAGAFGMTYLAWDTHLEKKVAIKEYLPTDIAVRALDGSVLPITSDSTHDYRWGLDRFLLEARTLARFSHPNIVRVNRYFESHGTACVVMDYEDGESLAQVLKANPNPSEEQLLKLTLPLLDGLFAVHDAGFLHRDIKPANVFIRKSGSPVLLDFGAARQALGGATKSLTAVLTPGYAPLEQYSTDGNQGPWTDIYALGGVLYRALMNENPPDATVRIRNDAVPGKLRTLRGRVGVFLLSAIDWALALDEKQRPQSVLEWRDAIQRKPAVAPSAVRPVAANPQPMPRPVPAAHPIPAPPRQPLPVANMPVAQTPQSPRVAATPVPARLPRRPPTPAGHTLSINLGWLVVVVVFVIGGGVWAARPRSHAAPPPAPVATGLTLETASGPVTIPGTVLSVRSAASADHIRPAPTDEPTIPGRSEAEAQQPAAETTLPEPRVVTLSVPSSSEPPPARHFGDRLFSHADANLDGFLSRDEARRFVPLARHFERLDVDGDGRISALEFDRMRHVLPPPPPHHFKK